MEELSIEEKAKAYDEAINKIMDYRKGNTKMYSDVNKAIDYLFPELKESENWIPKEIIKYLKEKGDFRSCWLAWLEKQGEQKSVKFKPLFRVGDVIKPKDPVLGEPRIIKGIHQKFGYDTNNGILDFEFEDNWELVEQKPAWSEDNKNVITAIIAALSLFAKEKDAEGCFDTEITWLKSLKDRVKAQPKQEWNEENKRIIDNLISQLGNLFARKLIKEETKDKYVNWLKSLKDRHTWKPSDEQMKQLGKYCPDNTALTALYEQLKKLRGE